MKKKLSIGDIGNLKKPERVEPKPKPKAKTETKTKSPAQKTAKKKTVKKVPRGRPSERTPYVQLNTRIKLETSQKIDDLVDSTGFTMREIIELAIEDFSNK